MKKNYTKTTKSCQICSVHTKLQSSITPRKKKKRNSNKSFKFRFLRWTRFLMIPLTFFYDEYIDRPKLSEQKKNPFEYIVPPSTSGVGTKKCILSVSAKTGNFFIIFITKCFFEKNSTLILIGKNGVNKTQVN